MSSKVSETLQKHVLVFPYPAQGHMLPMLDLTDQLVRRSLKVTILVTPVNLQIIEPLLSMHPGIQTLVFPFPGHPLIPEGVENVKDLGNQGNLWMINAMGKLYEPIVEWFVCQEEEKRPVAMIVDFFLGWTEKLAREVRVRRLVFNSANALLTALILYSYKEIDNVLNLDVVEYRELPGKPLVKHEHIPSIVLKYNKSNPDWEFVKASFIEGASSWGQIFNTFEDLEDKYLDHFKKELGQERVWAVGPLRLLKETRKTCLGSSSNILTWLDACPDGSVVYVCFGSQKTLSRDQMQGLAKGLGISGCRFLWGVKEATTAAHLEAGYGVVPEGFEEMVGQRGKVVRGWVPQDAILNHRSVAYFLSHCGWNSVLEAVSAGVEILAWPMEADQFVNAKFLVEEMRVAVKVCEGTETVPDPEMLAMTIAETIDGNEPLKMRVKALTDKAHKAVKCGGSSTRNLDLLVEKLEHLQANKI